MTTLMKDNEAIKVNGLLEYVSSILPEDIVKSSFNLNYYKHRSNILTCLRYLNKIQNNLEDNEINILDIGCGIGVLAITLKKLKYRVYCIDHPEVEKKSWLINEGIEFIHCNIENEKLPFANNTFDLITCLDVIEHLHSSPKRALKEINRVLKKEGYIIIETPNSANLRKRISVIFGRTNFPNIEYFFNSEYPYRGHIREYTKTEVKKIIQWSNFFIVDSFMRDYHIWSTKVKNMPGKLIHQQIYSRIFKLNSPKQIIKIFYWLICLAIPPFRQAITVIGRKH